MGVAKDIEQRLEGLVEGFFTKAFRSGLQPVEVGRRILREMGEGRTLSVNKTYAPNEFRVVMGPEDHERFEGMAAGLTREFSELIIDAAKANRWNLMGLPEISFLPEASLGRGEFRVEAAFAAAEGTHSVSTHDPSAGEVGGTGAMTLDDARRLGVERSGPQLLVLDEAGRPIERISLTRDPVLIGRGSDSDVVLSDPNVSRKHAELSRSEGRWVLVDLGSTNGTTVNDKVTMRTTLKDGDRIRFGTSELMFREGGG